ncbi:MAG: TetR/AcrR family transcriptional regulator, partial [Calditrichota bacterium]
MNQTGLLSDRKSTREKIFIAAAKLFAERGYNGVSMRELSESTGLSKPTIYYYFGNKEGIYTALVETGLHYGQEVFQKIAEQD